LFDAHPNAQAYPVPMGLTGGRWTIPKGGNREGIR